MKNNNYVDATLKWKDTFKNNNSAFLFSIVSLLLICD